MTHTAITADEFVASIEGFDELTPAIQTDLLVLYLTTYGGVTGVRPAAIASLRTALRLTEHRRLPAYLSESTGRKGATKGRYVKVADGYALQRAYLTGLQQTYLGRPAVRHLATSLKGTLSAVSDPAVKGYLDESIGTFEHGHLRAALILTWCVCYGLLRNWLFRNHLAALNAAMSAWKTPVVIARLDDFQDLTEGTVIETARKAGILTKEQHKTLKHLLDHRNSYAHPTTKPISPAIVEAYIDTAIREVLPAFG